VNVSPMYCGTIHRMIYTPIVVNGGVAGWSKKENLDYDLVVVDEASMLSRDVLADLMHYGVPVLLIGDDGQLSPVGDEGQPSVLDSPDCVLKTIHRQALNNPVLEFASLVRSGGDWRGMLRSSKDSRLQKISASGLSLYIADRFKDRLDKPAAEDPLVLCGTNRMKKVLNSAARIWLKDEVLVPGDRVVCLKNAYLSGALLANGFFGQVTSVTESRNPLQVRANITLPDEDLDLVEAILCKPQLTEDRTYSKIDEVPGDNFSWEDVGLLFSHGYALTGHRAQGGQRDEVIVYVEDFFKSDQEFRRWLYSVSTRCIKDLKVAL
jgi:exodeoxyribonuclease V